MGKARKCQIETVSVCLKKTNVGKLILYVRPKEIIMNNELETTTVGRR